MNSGEHTRAISTRIGAACALVGMGAIVVGIAVSWLGYQGYAPWLRYISELARPSNPLGWAFQAGLVAAGVLFVPFGIALAGLLSGPRGVTASRLVMLAGPMLSLTGLFPLTSPVPHFACAAVMFASAIFAELYVARAITTDDDRKHWLAQAQESDDDAARTALSKLAEAPGEGLRELLLSSVQHGSPRVRHHAMRLIRKTLPPEDSLWAARQFLHDNDAASRRMAVRIVCHGRDKDALPQVVALLLDPVAWVRREARTGLQLMAGDAIPWVQRARDRARPDDSRRYQDVLDMLLVEARSRP